MGVKGLWKVLRPSSEKVGPSSLSGKKVAIDASIWLYQISKGFRDKEGSELHAVVVRGFCTRICKLLEYRIYPIFIFEGRGTKIKKLTLATRRRRMEQSRKKADKVSMDLAVKRLRKYLMEKIHPADKKADKPIVPQKRRLSEYELPEGSVDIMQDAAVDPNFATRKEITRKVDELAADKDIVMNLDLDGDAFKCLPLQDQYDLLLDIKNKSRESHHSSKIVEVSEDPLKFSSLQVNYLLRRNELRRRLDAFNRPDIGSAGKGLTNFKYAKFAAQRDLQYVLLKEEPEDSGPKELLGREFLERSSSSDDLGSAGSGSDSGAGRGMDSGAGRGMDSGAGRGMDSGAGSGMDGGPEDLEGERLGNSDKSGDPISLGSSDFEEISLPQESSNLQDPKLGSRRIVFSNEPEYEIIGVVITNSMSKNEVESEILRELQNLALDENLVDQFATIVRNSLEVWSIKEVVALIQNLETLFVNPEAISPSKKIAVLDALVAVSRWRMSNMSQSERAAASPLMSPETAAPGGAELCEENASDSRNYSLKSQEFKSPDSKSPDSKSPDYRSPDFKSPDSKSPDHRSPDRPVGPPDDLPLDMIESTGAKTPKDAGLNLEQYDNQGLKLDINNLIKQKRLHLAQAESYDPTDVLEVKQILSALGIPFMHAPTEAEAQCAYFVSNGVVDAVITEDSDVLLFGGTNIYKNFFKRNQDIEMYSHKKIKESLDMNRFDLICMAYLLGSDYAEGVHGIGAFTASLIVKSWKEEGLEKIKRFKEWHESSESCKQHLPNSDILAKRCKTVHLPKNLCDPEVQDAYLNPEVDTNMKEFSWGCANIPAVYELLLEKSLDAGTIESIITQLQNISERREDIP